MKRKKARKEKKREARLIKKGGREGGKDVREWREEERQDKVHGRKAKE